MNLGLIIICHNCAYRIDKDGVIDCIGRAKNLRICLVNNDSSDKTHDLLNAIKENCENISVVNVKKHKSDTSAVRAGVRYMVNQFNIRYLGYVTNLNNHEIIGLIDTISQNQNMILNYYLSELNKRKIKQTLFKSIFSVPDCLEELNLMIPVNNG